MIYLMASPDTSTSMSLLSSTVVISKRVSRTNQSWLETKYIESKRLRYRLRKCKLSLYGMKFKIWLGLTAKAKKNMRTSSKNTIGKRRRSVRKEVGCERTILPWSSASKSTLIACRRLCKGTIINSHNTKTSLSCSFQSPMPKLKS